jgi:hypothetical protein
MRVSVRDVCVCVFLLKYVVFCSITQGYVKIAKWNDANFWAMKQAAEKSHRTLHKFVRRYEVTDSYIILLHSF